MVDRSGQTWDLGYAVVLVIRSQPEPHLPSLTRHRAIVLEKSVAASSCPTAGGLDDLFEWRTEGWERQYRRVS